MATSGHLSRSPVIGSWRSFNAPGALALRMFAWGLTMLVVTACRPLVGTASGREAAWNAYSEQLDVRDWNESIELAPVDVQMAPASEGGVDLLVMNQSNDEIWFPPGYGAILLTYSDDKHRWDEVENLVAYLGNGETIEPRVSESSNWVAVTSVAPALDLGDTPSLRILVVGQVVDGEVPSDELVGAYLDVNLPR